MHPSGEIKVSVIVTVRDDVDGTRELLEALVGQSRAPDEIVVVDGGSTDGTREFLAGFDAAGIAFRWLERPGANIAAGRNVAIESAAHDIIACTDAGCLPDSTWLEELVAPFSDADVTVVGGGYRVGAHTALERVVGLLTMPGELKPVDPLRFNPSARSLAFRRGAWRRAGGFPEWLETAEDTLFVCKLRCAELYAYAEQAIVRWRPRRALRGVWRQFRGYARGEAHIGRGQDTVAFWRRRYGIALICAVTAAAALGAAAYTAFAAAFLFAGVLLIRPVHRRAARVSRRTQRWLDYPRAVLISHWVALAALRGHAIGRRERTQDPHTYQGKLQAYWGTHPVASAPPWRMKHPPTPRTLVVSWHWPPANRASAQVLANLFAAAPQGVFQAITRDLPGVAEEPSPVASIPTHRVGWMLPDERERTLGTWLASILAALRMLRAARRQHEVLPFQRVIGVHPHRYSLLAAWWIARSLELPFVAYMHDLCAETLITRNSLKRLFWTQVDRRALNSAFMVMTPTREFALHYRSRGVLNSWVLPHCNPPKIQGPAPAPTAAANSRPLRILYAGSVYQAHEQALRALLDAEKLLEKVHVNYLCPPNRVVPSERARWVDRDAARAELVAADVLVVALSAQTPYPREIQGCFPSKMVDYLAAGKPILAIIPAGCFVDRFVRATGCGVVVNSQSPADVARVVNLLRDSSARAEMGAAARRVSAQLDAPRWMEQMCIRLAVGAPVDPSTPSFPVVEPVSSARPAGERAVAQPA